MSEVDDRGRLKGLIADLLTLMSQRAGLQFTLVPTRSWAQSMALFQDRKLDLIPAMTPTAERQQFARFTPNYASINRVVVARQGMAELTAARALKGHRVGMVGGSVEQVLLNEVGAIAVPVASDAELLPLLDQQKVDYVLMSTTWLGRASSIIWTNTSCSSSRRSASRRWLIWRRNVRFQPMNSKRQSRKMPPPREDQSSTVFGSSPVCMVRESHFFSRAESSSGGMAISTLVRICCSMGSCNWVAMAMGTRRSLPEKTTW